MIASSTASDVNDALWCVQLCVLIIISITFWTNFQDAQMLYIVVLGTKDQSCTHTPYCTVLHNPPFIITAVHHAPEYLTPHFYDYNYYYDIKL